MRTRYFIVTSIFLSMQVADLVTTLVALSRGGVEMNPFVAVTGMVAHPIVLILLKLFVAANVLLIAALALRWEPTVARVVYPFLVAGDVVLTLVVANNLIQLSIH